jgi:hypothetical protein
LTRTRLRGLDGHLPAPADDSNKGDLIPDFRFEFEAADHKQKNIPLLERRHYDNPALPKLVFDMAFRRKDGRA